MKGLILKDLYNIKSMARVYVLFAIFYTFLAITSGDSTFLAFMLFILCAMLPLAAMSFDEKANWDQYGLTMPVSRKDMVLSKYLLSIITIFFASIFLLIVNFAVPGNINDIVTGYFPLVLGLGVILLSIILPIHFKFGVEKGRIIMVVIYLIPTILVVTLNKMDVDILSMFDFFVKYYSPFNMLAFALLVLGASIIISLRVYQNKEV